MGGGKDKTYWKSARRLIQTTWLTTETVWIKTRAEGLKSYDQVYYGTLYFYMYQVSEGFKNIYLLFKFSTPVLSHRL